MTDLTNAVDQTKPAPLDLNEIRVWADYAKRENKEMGMAPDCAIALLDRLQQAERDRDHYYLSAEIEAREVDRQKAIAVAAVAKLLPALSACLKAMHHAAPFFQRGVEATLLADAIKAAQEALSDAVDPEPIERSALAEEPKRPATVGHPIQCPHILYYRYDVGGDSEPVYCGQALAEHQGQTMEKSREIKGVDLAEHGSSTGFGPAAAQSNGAKA